MPSFEHTNSTVKNTEDDVYQPGQNRNDNPQDASNSQEPDLSPVTQPLVSRVADVAAERALAESEQVAQPTRPSRYIDAHLGDPLPSILQNVRTTQSAPSQRKPNLRGRGQTNQADKAGVPGPGSIGLVSNPAEVKESLSGPQANAPRQPQAPSGSDTPRAPRANRENNRPDDQAPRKKHTPRERNQNDKPREPRPPRQEASAPRSQKPAAPKAAPKKPQSLFDRIKQFFAGLFGGPKPTHQPTREPVKPSGNNRPGHQHRRPHPGPANSSDTSKNQAENAPKRRRRRRGGRGGQNRRPSTPPSDN